MSLEVEKDLEKRRSWIQGDIPEFICRTRQSRYQL